MKATAIKGLAAVDLTTAQKVGTIDDIVLNLYTGKIDALIVKGVNKGEDVVIPATQVQSLGQDAVTFKGNIDTTAVPKATPTGVSEEGLAYLSGLINKYKLVSQSGALLGHIKDVLLDPSQLVVTGYDISEGGLFAKTHTLSTNGDIRFGPDLAIVPDSTIPTA